MEDKQDKNIPGIYNYCDRWCERCSYSDRCLVFEKENDRKTEHILNDEDPNDPEVFMQDIQDIFAETFELIEKEMGDINLDEIEHEDPPEPDFENYELHQKAEEFSDYCHALIKKLSFYLNMQKRSDEEEQTSEPDKPLPAVKEVLNVIGWYSPQIYVKSKRVIFSYEKYLMEKDEEMKGFDMEDAEISAKILYVGNEKCIAALEELKTLDTGFEDEAEDALTISRDVRSAILELFPNIPSYKRPYFD